MKRIVAVGPKKCVVEDFTVNGCSVPEIKDDQILVKIKYVGVCMSEHYAWSTAKPGQCFGHEPMGIVEKVGKNVTEFKPGDHVCGLWGNTLPGAGALCEYSIASRWDAIMKVPENLTDLECVVEPLACIYSAVSKMHKGVPGDRIAVVGCGYMGCGCISLLKACGAYVVAIDILPESLENAKKYGADEIYLSEEALKKFSTGTGQPMGFDTVIEWGETSESLDVAINITNMCGQLCIGAYHTGGKRLVDVQQLNVKAIDCLSVHPRQNDLNRKGAYNSVRMLANGEWKFRNVPTKVYPRNKFDLAHEEITQKYGIFLKSVIDMTWEDGEPYIVEK